MEESPEPEDADSAYDFPSDGGNGELNISRSNVAEQQNSIVGTSTRWNNEPNPDLRCLREYLEQHNTLYLLDNIPDADDVKFVDQTYILEAQPKKLFVGSHAKSGDDIYAYMVMLQQRGFHEIRFYVETANGYKTMIPAETTGKQRLLHPFSKTYPKTAGPSEPADRARFTLMIKWYFIAAGVATDCVLRETKNYPGRFRLALEYIADQLGPAAVKSSNFIAKGDAIPDDRSESSCAPEGIEVQPAPSREPRPKVPRFPLPYARKSAPSRGNYVASMKSSTQLPHRKNSFTKTSTSEEIALLNVVPRNGKRSAEDETFENLTRMILQQSDLTAQLNYVDHDLDVMDARLEAFKEKWKREREELEKKRSQIEEERSAVRNLFKKQKLLDAQED
ncbi:hypothetical protein ACET3X_002848 [Alternaria dauci]|uniref:Uncharacterized protein n=1 Tax=Alternaria dauci TaxID=48095 RepID=A0ABR3UQQ3_9PLEO